MATNKRLIKSNDEGGGVSFNTVLYTGDGTSSNEITSVGFQPDMVWIKGRDNGTSGTSGNPVIVDSVRGTTAPNLLATNLTIQEFGSAGLGVNAFGLDSFTVGDDANGGGNVNGAPGGLYSNGSYVAWCWKAGGAAVTNTDGTITSQVSANTEAGFSIVSYTVNSSSDDGKTVGHGLNDDPKIIIIKNRTLSGDWIVTTTVIDGSYDYLRLNKTDAKGDYTGIAAPTENVFTNTTSNASNVIAYCFAEVAGFSKFGSYVGNGLPLGPSIDLGFEPAFVMVKRTNAASGWRMIDNKRFSGGNKSSLEAQDSSAEQVGYIDIDFNATNFTINSTNVDFNAIGGTYIYMAFANQF